MWCVAWGTGCILEDNRHQCLADGCLPTPNGLCSLPTRPSRGPARCLAHKVGNIGRDDLEAVWVGARRYEAEVLSRLHCEDFRQWDFLVVSVGRVVLEEGNAFTVQAPVVPLPLSGRQEQGELDSQVVCKSKTQPSSFPSWLWLFLASPTSRPALNPTGCTSCPVPFLLTHPLF